MLKVTEWDASHGWERLALLMQKVTECECMVVWWCEWEKFALLKQKVTEWDAGMKSACPIFQDLASASPALSKGACEDMPPIY
eukprot:4124892-Karenia_brevis.AAC.1